MVGSIAVQQRAAVTPNQPLLTVVDLSVFEVELQVPESYADDLALDMPAEITYGNAKYEGRLTSISPEVRNSQVDGRVRFDGDAPADLRQNQRVSVRIVLEENARRADRAIAARSSRAAAAGSPTWSTTASRAARPSRPARRASPRSRSSRASPRATRSSSPSLEPFGRAETVLIRN